ncbi:MAG: hypothetical protein LUG91_00050 [Ruminococcus sp.]|nr:hypothetical protein [Ruminococcus sp.]
MKIISKVTSVEERRQRDDIQAMLETLAANQDYIAMMSGIDLDNETEENTSDVEEETEE